MYMKKLMNMELEELRGKNACSDKTDMSQKPIRADWNIHQSLAEMRENNKIWYEINDQLTLIIAELLGESSILVSTDKKVSPIPSCAFEELRFLIKEQQNIIDQITGLLSILVKSACRNSDVR